MKEVFRCQGVLNMTYLALNEIWQAHATTKARLIDEVNQTPVEPNHLRWAGAPPRESNCAVPLELMEISSHSFRAP